MMWKKKKRLLSIGNSKAIVLPIPLLEWIGYNGEKDFLIELSSGEIMDKDVIIIGAVGACEKTIGEEEKENGTTTKTNATAKSDDCGAERRDSANANK